MTDLSNETDSDTNLSKIYASCQNNRCAVILCLDGEPHAVPPGLPPGVLHDGVFYHKIHGLPGAVITVPKAEHAKNSNVATGNSFIQSQWPRRMIEYFVYKDDVITEKPSFLSPCTSCGFCCVSVRCSLGELLDNLEDNPDLKNTPCSWLQWTNGKSSCTLHDIEAVKRRVLPEYVDFPHFAELIAATNRAFLCSGLGCNSAGHMEYPAGMTKQTLINTLQEARRAWPAPSTDASNLLRAAWLCLLTLPGRTENLRILWVWYLLESSDS